MSGLTRGDTIALLGFVAVLVVGLGAELVRSSMVNSPRARLRQRLQESVAEAAPALEVELGGDDIAARPKHFGDSPLAQHMRKLKEQADHMGGAAGLRAIALAAAVAAVATGFGLNAAGMDGWLTLLAAPLAGLVGGVLGFRVMVQRYRQAFLNGLPDALDLMIRAVRAGVPVVHAIMTAGRELPYPVGREFQLIADSLRLGMDQQDVMDAASKRVGIPDFRFFVVCLQLQRETGGPLADTLENLSGIIRARREVRLKTRALTAQGRAASKIIAVVPFFVMGTLKLVGADYLDIMFDTSRGRTLLGVALTMIFVGLFVISRMTKLED